MNPLSNMTYDFFMGQLRLIAVGVIAWCAGRGLLTTADAGAATAIMVPAGLLAGPYIWSVYRNLGMKLVPHDSIAIDGNTALAVDKLDDKGKVPAGATITELASTAKVVGALLAALMLSALMVPDASAQGLPRKLTGNVVEDFANASKLPFASPAPAGTFDSAMKNFGDGIQKIEKAFVDKGIADLQAAIKDATDHNDRISLPCWQANLELLKSLPSQWPEPPTMPMGIALAIQVQRDLMNSINGSDEKSLKVACAALWGDQLKIVANLGALIGVRIATGGLL